MHPGHHWHAVVFVGLFAVAHLELRAQKCLTELGDVSTVSTALAKTSEPAVVFDIAARYGQSVVPALHRLSKPNRPLESPEGAAQAALAKLGDKGALEELMQELEGTQVREKRPAILKLGFAGTSETISILVSFLLTDNCRHCLDLGDASYDPRVFVHETLTAVLPNPPIEGRAFGDQYLPAWEAWWQNNKGHVTLTEPHRKLSDPNLRCLAVRAEWHDPEAVALFAEAGGPSAISVLQDLVHLGYKDELGSFNSVRGAARTALAMLGDSSEFDAIVQQLKSWDYVDALLKLRYVGTKHAVDAITMNIGEIAYITSNRIVPYDYDAQVRRHRNEFLSTLAQMAPGSPLTQKDLYTDHDVELWKDWWAKNKNKAELVQGVGRR